MNAVDLPAAQSPSYEAVVSLVLRHVETAEGGSFLLERSGAQVGELDYVRDGGVLSIDHTRVDPALRGAGEGARLVEAAVALARAEGLKVRPACSFARALFARRPDWRALLDVP